MREIYTDTASPMSLPLQWGQEAAMMYDYSPTPRGIHAAVEEALRQETLLRQEKDLLPPGSRELAQVQERGPLPQDEKQLHTLLMTEGDLTGSFSRSPRPPATSQSWFIHSLRVSRISGCSFSPTT